MYFVATILPLALAVSVRADSCYLSILADADAYVDDSRPLHVSSTNKNTKYMPNGISSKQHDVPIYICI